MDRGFQVHYAAGLVVFLVLVLVVFVGIVIEAWLEVKAAPREEMVICQHHGPIRSSLLLKMPGFNKNDPLSGYCPLCFHETLQKAEKGLL